jgi:ribosome-binding factor A
MGTAKEQELSMHGLRSAAGFVQAKLGDRLKTRFTPVVKFVLDEGVKKSIEMSRLLAEERAQAAGAGPAPPPDDQEAADEEPRE